MGVERLLPTKRLVELALLLGWHSALLVATQHHGQHHTAAAQAATTSHVKLFTIYDQQEELWDNASTHHAANLMGIINARLRPTWRWANQLRTNPSTQFNFTSIERSFHKHGVASFLDIEDMTWLRQLCGVQSNWQTNLDAVLSQAKPHLDSGAVIGVFLGDELACSGVRVENITHVASWVKLKLSSLGHPNALLYCIV